jgi:hypothetical protein
MKHRLTALLLTALTLALVSLPNMASACATCFGKSDSRLAHGMNMGILSLLVVVVFVLSAFAAFFVFLARRASMTPPPEDPAE